MIFAPAHHESAHAVAAWVVGLPIQHASIRTGDDGSLGRCSLVRDEATLARIEDDPLSFAVMLVAGEQAERFALGREPWYRVNWFRDDPDSDEDRAREWIATEASRNGWDELSCRALVQLRGRGLVFSHWEEIESLSSTLQQRTTLLGDEATRIITTAHNGKLRERDRHLGIRPISKTEAMKRMTPRGKQRPLGTVAADGRTVIEKAVKR